MKSLLTFSAFMIISVVVLFSLTGCDECEDPQSPNLYIPPTVTIPNPFNGTVGTFINEWYYLDRFSTPGFCTDCFGNPYLDGFGNPIVCSGWLGQGGYFYYGQCTPSFIPGDSIIVLKYIFNTALPPGPFCEEATASSSTTRIIVRDTTDQELYHFDQELPAIEPQGYAIFQAYVIWGENGVERYEVITDYLNEINESNELDNIGEVPGLDFN